MSVLDTPAPGHVLAPALLAYQRRERLAADAAARTVPPRHLAADQPPTDPPAGYQPRHRIRRTDAR